MLFKLYFDFLIANIKLYFEYTKYLAEYFQIIS